MSQFNNLDNEPLLFPELEEFFRPKEKTTKEEQQMTEENFKTISEVAKDFNIAPSVIRYWETKFKELSPIKRNGRRYFSVDQQALIKRIQNLLYVQGYTIKAAQNLIENGFNENSYSYFPKKETIDSEFINSVISKLERIKETLQ